MPRVDPADLFSDPAERSRIIAEAEFGLHEIGTVIAALPAGARVLEVGCGTGFLLAKLASIRADLVFSGLEPLGQGFEAFEQTLTRIETEFSNLTIHRTGIEEFALPPDEPAFDLIFSVNVFEHLDDWRQAVANAAGLMRPGGSMVVLCPNYAVPYEPHFTIPIVGSGKLTRRLFARHIERVERDTNSHGLWNSLNFISVPAFREECRRRGLELIFDRGVMARMLARLDSDPEFRRRQATIAGVAGLLRKLGAGWFSERLPAVMSPYMKAIVTRPPIA